MRCIRERLRRNPALPAERVDEGAIAATTQIGDQGLTIGRTAALLAGLPTSVPGWPFWLGGISAHLDRTGVSEAVTGTRFLPNGVASLPA